MSEQPSAGTGVHRFVLELEASTASLLRIVARLHTRGVDVRALSYVWIRPGVAQVDAMVETSRPAALSRRLATGIDVLDVVLHENVESPAS